MNDKINGICITACIVILMLMPIMLIISYSSRNKKDDETEVFVTIESHTSYSIMYDKETKVIYAVSNSGTKTFCPLYNADGSLKVYKENNNE